MDLIEEEAQAGGDFVYTYCHLLYLSISYLFTQRQKFTQKTMWKVAQAQVGNVDKIVSIIKPLKTTFDAVKWVLKSWMLVSFAEGTQPEGASKESLDQLLELSRRVAAEASQPDCVTLATSVIAKMNCVDAGITQKTNKVLKELINGQKVIVESASSKLDRQDSLKDLIQSSKKLSAILSAVALHQLLPVEDVRKWTS